MSKLFAKQPLRQRAILVLYVGTVTLIAVAAAHFADAQAFDLTGGLWTGLIERISLDRRYWN